MKYLVCSKNVRELSFVGYLSKWLLQILYMHGSYSTEFLIYIISNLEKTIRKNLGKAQLWVAAIKPKTFPS